MSWTTPKTDWVESTRWDATDLNRLTNNLLFLQEYCSKLFAPPQYSPMRVNLSYTSYLYAFDINRITENLKALNLATFNYPLSQLPVFYANQHLPTYTYFNEVEALMLQIKTSLDTQIATMTTYPAKLNNTRGVKV